MPQVEISPHYVPLSGSPGSNAESPAMGAAAAGLAAIPGMPKQAVAGMIGASKASSYGKSKTSDVEGTGQEDLFKKLDSYLQGNLSDNDAAVIKAMIWKESKMGYYTSSSPNANVSIDILQVLDPRNPMIYEFCTYNLDTTTNVKILDGNGNYVLPHTIDSTYNYQKSRTTYNTPVADRLFNKASDGYYHYQYQNSSQLLSVALGIRTYAIKLDAANGNVLLAAQEYNGSTHKVQYMNDVNDLAFNGGFLHADSYN
ncbi:hypothetical protein ABFV83_12360 [Lacrimispora sp. BS-2]|uniref:Uncharacterized protein n=1 Tax=Lacrimispora sp. BS-2 TaxID=3151850 RepID=A0AAU7PJR7_9FIRM